MSINVDGAAARLLANRTLAAAGYCLHYCWLAISQGLVHYISGGAGSAYATWLAVPAQHQHSSREVPKDFPAFLGPKLLSRAGDVIISSGTRNASGELLFAATDWPTARQVGLCTLAEREHQTGRRFVGWASSMGGHELTAASLAGQIGNPTPIAPPRKKDDMEFRIITQNGVAGEAVIAAVVYDSTTYSEINPATDPVEATTAEAAHGAGANRMYLSAEQWRIEKIFIGKRAAEQIAAIVAAIPASGTTGATVDIQSVLDAIKSIPKPPTGGTITLT